MQHYDTLDTREINGFTVVIDKTWEDIHPRQCFDEADVKEICKKIDDGTYDWFMLRVRAYFKGLEVSSAYLGGMCYENARECLTDGSAASVIDQALYEAELELTKLRDALNERAIA